MDKESTSFSLFFNVPFSFSSSPEASTLLWFSIFCSFALSNECEIKDRCFLKQVKFRFLIYDQLRSWRMTKENKNPLKDFGLLKSLLNKNVKYILQDSSKQPNLYSTGFDPIIPSIHFQIGWSWIARKKFHRCCSTTKVEEPFHQDEGRWIETW